MGQTSFKHIPPSGRMFKKTPLGSPWYIVKNIFTLSTLTAFSKSPSLPYIPKKCWPPPSPTPHKIPPPRMEVTFLMTLKWPLPQAASQGVTGSHWLLSSHLAMRAKSWGGAKLDVPRSQRGPPMGNPYKKPYIIDTLWVIIPKNPLKTQEMPWLHC